MVNVFIVMPAPIPQPQDEFGSERLAKDSIVTKIFRSKDTALEYAKEQAKKKPGVQVVVVGPVCKIVQAKEPEIIESVVNDTGEVIPQGL